MDKKNAGFGLASGVGYLGSSVRGINTSAPEDRGSHGR